MKKWQCDWEHLKLPPYGENVNSDVSVGMRGSEINISVAMATRLFPFSLLDLRELVGKCLHSVVFSFLFN